MQYRLRNNYSKNPEVALKEILIDRGVQEIETFLEPSNKCELNPYDLDNIEAAADNLLKHLRRKSSICFIVDCDCDGFTSSAILWNYIKAVFPEVQLNFTVHEKKQHGLSDKIDWLEFDTHFDLVLLPDAGSFDGEYHKRLADVGTEIIVLDHHELPDDYNMTQTPLNTIIVNNQLSERYGNKSLCGAGVVYKFCQVLDDKLGISLAENFMDLAALGEIADVMSRTTSETNYIMMEGLRRIKNKGFKTLLEEQSFSLKEKAMPPYLGLTPIDVAFYIAPMINAITRVGTIQEKETMFYAFVEPDRLVKSTKRGAKEGDTETAAKQTARVGNNAKNRQNKLKEKAIDLIDFKIQKDGLDENNILIVEVEERDNIPQEIGGLVAMAIVNKYNRPCLIVRRNSEGMLQGSGRNNENFKELPSLKDFLENSGYFEYCMGHANAHGASIHYKKLPQFIDYANSYFSADAFENCYIVDYVFDANEKSLEEVGYSIAGHNEFFGNGIAEVKIIVKNIPLQNILVMGSDKSSIKISYNGIDYVKFKDVNFIEEIQNNRLKKIDVLARLNLNTFAGRTSVQCFIDDYDFAEDTNKYDF